MSSDDVRGVPLWRGDGNLFFHPSDIFIDDRLSTHVAHSLSADAQEKRRHAAVEAIVHLSAERYRLQAARSQELFGHPGAHIATIPDVSTAEQVDAVLALLGLTTDRDPGAK